MEALLESWRSMTTNNSILLRESVDSTGGLIGGVERIGGKIGQEKEISEHLVYLHAQVDRILDQNKQE